MTQPEDLCAALLRAKTQSALSVVVVPSCHATLCRPFAFVLTSWALCQLPAARTFTSQLLFALLWAAPPHQQHHTSACPRAQAHEPESMCVRARVVSRHMLS